MESKSCRKCGETKPRSEFHRRAASKDGLQFYCKACKRIPGLSPHRVTRPPFKPSLAQQLDICDAYEAGETLASIGERLDANPKSIWYVLENHSVQRRRGGYEAGKYQGEKSWNWKGGTHKTSQGYIRRRLIPDDPFIDMATGPHNLVFEHRYVMARHLGRCLLPEEDVHHKNGLRDDNRLENLELWCTSHQRGQRVEDLVEWAQAILDRYASVPRVG